MRPPERTNMERVCKICGKTFEATNRKMEMCSEECRKENIKRLQAERYEKDKELRNTHKRKLTCPICNKTFIPLKGPQKYCSKECQYENKKLSERARRSERRTIQRHKPNRKSQKPLVDIAIAARAAGMSYGQYVAREMMKNEM